MVLHTPVRRAVYSPLITRHGAGESGWASRTANGVRKYVLPVIEINRHTRLKALVLVLSHISSGALAEMIYKVSGIGHRFRICAISAVLVVCGFYVCGL